MGNVITRALRNIGDFFTIRVPDATAVVPIERAFTPPTRPATYEALTYTNVDSIPAVARAKEIIVNGITQCPIGVFNRNMDKVNTPAIIANPNVEETQEAFIEELVTSLTDDGNFYIRVHRPGGTVTNLEVLNPHNMTVDRDPESFKIRYLYTDVDGKQREYGRFVRNGTVPISILHGRINRKPGQLKGQAPTQRHQEALQGMLDMRKYVNNFVLESGVPKQGGYLSSDQHIDPTIADEYATRWHQAMANGQMPVLGKGLEYKLAAISPKDAMFVDIQSMNVAEVARMFGIHPVALNAAMENGSLTYITLETLGIEFVKFTLRRYLKEIQNALSELLPRGTTVKMNVSGLLAADIKTRFDSYAIGVAGGWITVEDVVNLEKEIL